MNNAIVTMGRLNPPAHRIMALARERREQLVLKRLRTGETSDGEILAGTAAPAVAVAWTQIAVAGVAALAVSGLGRPANAVLALVALAGGSVVFVLLAVVSAAVTRSVEVAQITTLPVLIIPFAFSGLVSGWPCCPSRCGGSRTRCR